MSTVSQICLSACQPSGRPSKSSLFSNVFSSCLRAQVGGGDQLQWVRAVCHTLTWAPRSSSLPAHRSRRLPRLRPQHPPQRLETDSVTPPSPSLPSALWIITRASIPARLPLQTLTLVLCRSALLGTIPSALVPCHQPSPWLLISSHTPLPEYRPLMVSLHGPKSHPSSSQLSQDLPSFAVRPRPPVASSQSLIHLCGCISTFSSWSSLRSGAGTPQPEGVESTLSPSLWTKFGCSFVYRSSVVLSYFHKGRIE